MLNRRRLLVAGLTAALASACQRGESGPTTSHSGSSSSPTPSSTSSGSSASPTAWPEMTVPGQARRVVNELQETAKLPVIKLDITRTEATLSALDGKLARAWRWNSGQISEVDSDIEYIQQSSFDPKDFALDDVGALFTKAQELSGNAANQELQVVEQNPGSVMMVVTTRPESEAVFFRPDGTAVLRLDFATREGLDEGLRDAVDGRTQITMVALTREGLYAESPDLKDSESTLRVTRPKKIPAFRTSRKESATLSQFSPTDVPVDLLIEQMKTLPMRWNKPASTPVTWVIDRRDNRPLPTIRFTCDGRTMVTDLEGRDITAEV